MKLTYADMKSGQWSGWGGTVPGFDVDAVRASTLETPEWVHFGAGNIFRGFVAANHQQLLDSGKANTGIIAVETFDYDIISRIYAPHDNLTLNVSARSDGTLEQAVVASVVESLTGDFSNEKNRQRLETLFSHPELKMVSFTITEKGYALNDASGEFLAVVQHDFEKGPRTACHVMSIVVALLYQRFSAGELPIALVSMDNCSRNGELLKKSLVQIAQEWEKRGYTAPAFTAYLQNDAKVACPWSMIDRITPRPSRDICTLLEEDGWVGMAPLVTAKHTHIAPFVNAEETKYLFIEDNFPNGRIPLNETAGIWFTDRDTVNKVETMKVTTCLNPLHTAIAVVGSLLNYTLVSKAVADKEIDKLIYRIGYEEGLPVVIDPGLIAPKDFLDQVYHKRFPNPYIPDAPQRIATDTSMKVGIRFGETILSYQNATNKNAADLVGIPLAIAAWFRYLLGVDDLGKQIEVSPDPRKEQIQSELNLSDPFGVPADLSFVLSNKEIFGVDLKAVGLAPKIQEYFAAMCAGPGAVRKVLQQKLYP